jgi:hypothetical protein
MIAKLSLASKGVPKHSLGTRQAIGGMRCAFPPYALRPFLPLLRGHLAPIYPPGNNP